MRLSGCWSARRSAFKKLQRQMCRLSRRPTFGQFCYLPHDEKSFATAATNGDTHLSFKKIDPSADGSGCAAPSALLARRHLGTGCRHGLHPGRALDVLQRGLEALKRVAGLPRGFVKKAQIHPTGCVRRVQLNCADVSLKVWEQQKLTVRAEGRVVRFLAFETHISGTNPGQSA